MPTYHVVDQTDYGHSVATVRETHFGANAVTIYDQELGAAGSELADLVIDMNISNLRYPGGSATEHFFDTAQPNLKRSTFDGGVELLPMDQFMRQAGESGFEVTIVVPTKRAFGVTAGEAMIDGSYGDRSVVDEIYIDDVLGFVDHSVSEATKYGTKIAAFEIGNEFWGSGEMTAREYGHVAGTLAPLIETRLVELNYEAPSIAVQSLRSASNLYSPRDDVSAWVENSGNDFKVYTWEDIEREHQGWIDPDWTQVVIPGAGTAYQQVLALANAAKSHAGAAEAIEAIVLHYYRSAGFSGADDGNRFGFSQAERLARVLDPDASHEDYDTFVTEWGEQISSLKNNRGMQHAQITIEHFYELVSHGVDAANKWPLSFNHSQSTTLVSLDQKSLTIGGEIFKMMSESLVGLTPSLDWSISEQVDIHGFSGSGHNILFVSERSGQFSPGVTLDLSAVLEDGQYFVTGVQLWDGGAGGLDHRALPEFSYLDGGLITNRLIDFDLDPWAVLRLEVSEVGDSHDIVTGQLGHDTIYAFGGDDTLSGEGGNDRLYGGDGDDRLDGGQGNDHLWGGSGNDILVSSTGDDTLTGGLGRDTFVFKRGGGNDVISDFNIHSDVLHIDGRALPSLNQFIRSVFPELQGGKVEVGYGVGDSVDLILNGTGYEPEDPSIPQGVDTMNGIISEAQSTRASGEVSAIFYNSNNLGFVSNDVNGFYFDLSVGQIAVWDFSHGPSFTGNGDGDLNSAGSDLGAYSFSLDILASEFGGSYVQDDISL